ncbi:GxxExxY protein [Candidatus Falkowbacteria bacterium]|nr:GxxExxY protein [Candidatus Falkowbacteria bacterium]
MSEIIYKDLCYVLNGIFFYIHNKLGPNCSEKQYQEGVALKLSADNIFYEREKKLFIKIGNGKVGGNQVDFLVESKLPVDLKAKKYITREDFKQMLRYLKAGNYRLGLIVNFRGLKVQIKRVVNSDLH